ncbi:prepilin-type N-terminal cleavage/methylation domain-containing protein [Geminocystis sp.]|uniref:type IV pilus modification PilV family protein n=1 Tax=Geminocystis sp. TaxID=2664100 RepID=UPI0035937C1B
MKKNYFPSLLKYYFLIQKRKQTQGFSFIEVLVAITVLSIAFAVNLQFLLALKIQNLEQKTTMGAVSLTKEILDGLRYDWRKDVDTSSVFKQTRSATTPIVTTPINNTGTTEFTLSDDRAKDFGGYKYKVVINICSNEPTVTDDVVSNCLSTSEDIKYVVVQIKNKKLEELKYDSTTKAETFKTSEQVYLTTSATIIPLQQSK